MATAHVAARTAAEIAKAATAFLDTLGPEQRSTATFDFESDERENWHYVPRPRAGLARSEMNRPQLEAANALIATSLSEMGLRKSLEIINLETILGRIEGGEGVSRFDRDPGLYYYSVFGGPGSREPWGWQVDGHHLSLNFTVVNGEIVSATPSFFGANPAEVKQGPEKGLRVLEDEEDVARALFLSLDAGQTERATLYADAPADIITKADRRAEIRDRVGLPAEAMNADQRQLLMSLVKVYVDRKAEEVAGNAMRKLEEQGVSGIHFGWAGGVRRGEGHYYRVHGPSFLVEYDNTQNIANHVHSVWRDVDDDFGADVLRVHYMEHHR